MFEHGNFDIGVLSPMREVVEKDKDFIQRLVKQFIDYALDRNDQELFNILTSSKAEDYVRSRLRGARLLIQEARVQYRTDKAKGVYRREFR